MDATTYLEIGATLQLQPLSPKGSKRSSVRLIGYVPNRSLVVTAPRHNGQSQLMREGREFAVRLLRENRAEGFVSHVLMATTKPYPHMHLSYPEKVESILVRDAQRIDISVPAIARNLADPDSDEYRLAALVVDISLSGARVWTNRPPGRRNDSVRLAFDIEVAGRTETLVLIGDIRNASTIRDTNTHDIEGYYHGIQFRDLTRHQELVIHGWVLEHRAQLRPAWGAPEPPLTVAASIRP